MTDISLDVDTALGVFDEVFKETLEEYRLLVGAEKIHLSLGSGATIEGIRDHLKYTHNLEKEYNSFSELERANAKIARYKARLGRICQLGRSTAQEFSTQTEEVRDLKSQIFNLCDLFGDEDPVKEIEWMKLNREDKVATRHASNKIFEK